MFVDEVEADAASPVGEAELILREVDPLGAGRVSRRRGAGDVTTPGAGVLRSKLEAAEARLASAVADREARLAEAEALRRRAWASSVTGSRGRDEIEALARTVIAKSEKVLREDD